MTPVASAKDYFTGMLALYEDRSFDAHMSFLKCKGVYEDEAELDELILEARIGEAFDKADYRAMHGLCGEKLMAKPGDPMRMLALASSAACLFATVAGDVYRDEAEGLIAKAKAAPAESSAGGAR